MQSDMAVQDLQISLLKRQVSGQIRYEFLKQIHRFIAESAPPLSTWQILCLSGVGGGSFGAENGHL